MEDKKLILIIDDDINIQLTLSHILTRAGLQVMTLMNDDESIRKVITKNIDLIIIDFDLKAKESECPLSRIRQKLADVPVIVLTHYPSEEIYNCCHKFEQCELIIKPINPETILNVVTRMLGRAVDPEHQANLFRAN